MREGGARSTRRRRAARATPHSPTFPHLSAQDNRYWTMYKLPMFGCTDSSQVLKEIDNATKSFPKAYIRLVAFDPNRQVQVAGMLVHRPAGANDLQPMAGRSV